MEGKGNQKQQNKPKQNQPKQPQQAQNKKGGQKGKGQANQNAKNVNVEKVDIPVESGSGSMLPVGIVEGSPTQLTNTDSLVSVNINIGPQIKVPSEDSATMPLEVGISELSAAPQSSSLEKELEKNEGEACESKPKVAKQGKSSGKGSGAGGQKASNSQQKNTKASQPSVSPQVAKSSEGEQTQKISGNSTDKKNQSQSPAVSTLSPEQGSRKDSSRTPSPNKGAQNQPKKGNKNANKTSVDNDVESQPVVDEKSKPLPVEKPSKDELPIKTNQELDKTPSLEIPSKSDSETVTKGGKNVSKPNKSHNNKDKSGNEKIFDQPSAPANKIKGGLSAQVPPGSSGAKPDKNVISPTKIDSPSVVSTPQKEGTPSATSGPAPLSLDVKLASTYEANPQSPNKKKQQKKGQQQPKSSEPSGVEVKVSAPVSATTAVVERTQANKQSPPPKEPVTTVDQSSPAVIQPPSPVKQVPQSGEQSPASKQPSPPSKQSSAPIKQSSPAVKKSSPVDQSLPLTDFEPLHSGLSFSRVTQPILVAAKEVEKLPSSTEAPDLEPLLSDLTVSMGGVACPHIDKIPSCTSAPKDLGETASEIQSDKGTTQLSNITKSAAVPISGSPLKCDAPPFYPPGESPSSPAQLTPLSPNDPSTQTLSSTNNKSSPPKQVTSIDKTPNKNDKPNQKSGGAAEKQPTKSEPTKKEGGVFSAKLPKGNPNSSPSSQNPITKTSKKTSPKLKEPETKPVESVVKVFEPPAKVVQSIPNRPQSNSQATNTMKPQTTSSPSQLSNGNKPSPNQPSSLESNKPPVVTAPPLIAPIISSDVPNNSDPNAKKEKKKRHKKSRSFKKLVKEETDAPTQNGNSLNSLAGEVAKARQHIKNSLQCIDDIANMTSPSAVAEVSNRLSTLEKENADLRLRIGDLTALLSKMEVRVKVLEKAAGPSSTVALQTSANNAHAASQVVINNANAASQATAPVKTAGSQAKPQAVPKKDDDDDGVDLFASDSEEEDAEASKIREQRLADYAAKKSKKPALIAKSSVILDIKPWDDETDMKAMEERVRKITSDGLLWGASKLVPLAYGIHKLQINCVVEDEKVSIDWLQETIEEIEDYVQSVDIAAFNKI